MGGPEGRLAVDTAQGAGVVVTGAGGGIGAAPARRFAAGGARVVVDDLDLARIEPPSAPRDASTARRAGSTSSTARRA